MLIRVTFLILFFVVCPKVDAQNNKKFQEALVRISIYGGTHKSAKVIDSGLGVFISKDGKFITNRSLIKKAVQRPAYYRIKVTNFDGAPLSNLKLAKCGLASAVDICLMKVNYSSLFWFKIAKEKVKSDAKLKTIRDSSKYETVDATMASYQNNNFTEIMILRSFFDKKVPRGAPVYDQKGTLHGVVVTYDGDKYAEHTLHAIPAEELSMLSLLNSTFFPIKRSRDANYFLSELEKMLREKKPFPSGSIGDLRYLRNMERNVQMYWPSYKADVDSQGVQELKRLYELTKKFNGNVRFIDQQGIPGEQLAGKIMERKKILQQRTARIKQRMGDLELEIEKKNGNSISITEKKIHELISMKSRLENERGDAEDLLAKQEMDLKSNTDKKTKEILKKSIELNKENIKSNQNRCNGLQKEIDALKKTRGSSKFSGGNSSKMKSGIGSSIHRATGFSEDRNKTPQELEYEQQYMELKMLEEKIKNLDTKAIDLFEDAI